MNIEQIVSVYENVKKHNKERISNFIILILNEQEPDDFIFYEIPNENICDYTFKGDIVMLHTKNHRNIIIANKIDLKKKIIEMKSYTKVRKMYNDNNFKNYKRFEGISKSEMVKIANRLCKLKFGDFVYPCPHYFDCSKFNKDGFGKRMCHIFKLTEKKYYGKNEKAIK